MKIIFFGSDDFAVAHLKGLLDNGHEVDACVAPPDRARGRGMDVQLSPVKAFALEHNIPVVQPENFQNIEMIEGLKEFEADIFVVIAYGRILPQVVLDIPEFGSINVHGSLLPKYRGAGPINWAIINGETETGLSIIRMNARMDAGDVISQKVVKIHHDETSITLREKLKKAGVGLLNQTLDKIENGKAEYVRQDESEVTYAPKLTKEMGRIDWSQPAEKIHNLVRGLLPWPGACTLFEGKQLKILKTEVSEVNGDADPGEVIDVGKDYFTVAAGCGALEIKYVHLADSKAMAAEEFLRGYPVKSGYVFS